jgi:transcription initiation factor TFIIIB Brf1 subunit/transcription initiation factor TFIIB
MVTIVNYALRESKEGKPFISLQLQGDLELVQSLETGKFYATARRCSMTSTFDEETAKRLIGTKIKGRIKRSQCDAYDYTVPETGEIISLMHTYEYVPEEAEDLELMPEIRNRAEITA